jgi:2-polyprenyl-3-methyl-5-hydroxy-6-metoxy-1,4-benzoquinol methylase
MLAYESKYIEVLEQCPWCGSPCFEKWGEEVRGFISVQCKDCGLIFVKNRLNQEGLREYYRNYLSTVHQADKGLNVKRDKMYRLEFDFVNRYATNTDVLDIGCSGGYFLDVFKTAGYQCFGIEFGEEAAKQAALKHTVFRGDFLKLDVPKQFDLIVFRGVLEHASNAKAYLEKALGLLRSAGLIYITSTPNAESFCARLFKEHWNQHHPEGHLVHFSKRHFDDYFKAKQFAKVSEQAFYEETPYADLENDILNVARAINYQREQKPIDFTSPAFWGNTMSLIYQKMTRDSRS